MGPAPCSLSVCLFGQEPLLLLLTVVVVVVVVVVEVGWVPLSLLPSEQAILAGAIPKPQGRSTEFAERENEVQREVASSRSCRRRDALIFLRRFVAGSDQGELYFLCPCSDPGWVDISVFRDLSFRCKFHESTGELPDG